MSQTPQPIKTRRWPRLLAGIIVALVVIAGAIYVAMIQFDVITSPFQRQPAPFPTPADTRDGRWEQDLAYLASELPALHRNAFFASTREAFDAQVNALNAQIPSLTDDQIILGMAAIVASLGDGHTRIYMQENDVFSAYPIFTRWYGDDLIVTSAHPDYREAVGARIVRIGDTDVMAARDAVAPYIAHDNDGQLMNTTPLYLRTADVLVALGIVTDGDRAPYTFEHADGTTVTLDLTPVPFSQPFDTVSIYDVLGVPQPVRLQNDAIYWYTYLEDSRTIYFQYNSASNDPEQPFVDFNREMFAFIDANPVERVVIDLRFNGGGSSSILDPFIEALRARPALNTRGVLYTLIGRGTFSSAMMNAIDMKTQTNSILLGEPTGGRPNGYGETRTFTLPNSGLEVQYSTRFFRNWPDGDAPGYPPDVPVDFTWADLLAGRDPVLEAALAGV